MIKDIETLLDKLDDTQKLEVIRYMLTNELEALKNEAPRGDDWPRDGDRYWWVNDTGNAWFNYYNVMSNINVRHVQTLKKIGNIFKTEEDAEKYKEQLEVTQLLRDIADELNDTSPIDWEDSYQRKYFLACGCTTNTIVQNWNCHVKTSSIYCTDEDYKNTAIALIGKDRLINYFKNNR